MARSSRPHCTPWRSGCPRTAARRKLAPCSSSQKLRRPRSRRRPVQNRTRPGMGVTAPLRLPERQVAVSHAKIRRYLSGMSARKGVSAEAAGNADTNHRAAPLEATVFEMERLRCNACGQIFTAEQPQAAGTDKYDATAVAMIALLKYGTGTPSTAWKSCSINWECRCRRPHNGTLPKPPHNSSGQP